MFVRRPRRIVKSKHNHAAKLGFERLEDRTLLAGNIVARITGGNLSITGDAQANQVLVEKVGPSSVQLTSLDGTTRINNNTSVVLNGFHQRHQRFSGKRQRCVAFGRLRRELHARQR